MLENFEESVYTMRPKFYKEPNYDTNDERPKVILRTHDLSQHFDNNTPMVSLWVADLSSSHGETLNAITRGSPRLSLKWQIILNKIHPLKNLPLELYPITIL